MRRPDSNLARAGRTQWMNMSGGGLICEVDSQLPPPHDFNRYPNDIPHGPIVMTTEHSDWLTVTYPGVAAFCMPADATQRLIDDDCTICVTHDGTDVLASIFPVQQSLSASSDSLELELRDFTDRCVRSQVEIATESYKAAADVDFPDVTCIQAVLNVDPDRVWIARAYARIGGSDFLLIHWNGPRNLATKFPINLFVSLIPLFAIPDGG